MAGKRKQPTKGQQAYGRRNELARLAGYRNYYDYRAHNHGKIPAGQPAPKGEPLARLRGHRSRADLERTLSPGALLTVQSTDRQADGRLTRAVVLVIDERGRERTFVLRGPQLKQKQLDELVQTAQTSGAVFAPSPSLDVRRLKPAKLWAFARGERWLRRFGAGDRALTTDKVAEALTFEGDDEALHEFLDREPRIERKGFEPVDLEELDE